MYIHDDAHQEYNRILDYYFSDQQDQYVQAAVQFQASELYKQLTPDAQFSLGAKLVHCWIAKEQYKDCLEHIEILRNLISKHNLGSKYEVRALASHAEVLFAMGSYDEGYSLFEKALNLVKSEYEFEDVSRSWRDALGSVEVKYIRKPQFLDEMAKKWQELRAALVKLGKVE